MSKSNICPLFQKNTCPNRSYCPYGIHMVAHDAILPSSFEEMMADIYGPVPKVEKKPIQRRKIEPIIQNDDIPVPKPKPSRKRKLDSLVVNAPPTKRRRISVNLYPMNLNLIQNRPVRTKYFKSRKFLKKSNKNKNKNNDENDDENDSDYEIDYESFDW